MRVFIVSCCLLAAPALHAQKLSIEAFAGLANYQGDLQESRYTLSQSRPAFSLGLGYALTPRFSLRGLATIGSIQASDRYNKRIELRERNLNFTSAVYDASLTGIYHLNDLSQKRFTPYALAGISVFRFNPYTRDENGDKTYLRDLGTEGQGLAAFPDREPYQLVQFSIPLGAGLKYVVNDNVNIGWEFRFHKTFTDYLDDVSTTYADEDALRTLRGQKAVDLAFRTDELKADVAYPASGVTRGGSRYKDWYYFTGITASFRLNSSGDGLPSRRGNGSGCPKVF